MATKYRGAIHKVCHRCDNFPGQWVRFFQPGDVRGTDAASLTTDADYEALCYTCWRPLADAYRVKVIYWINKYGKEMYAPGAKSPR